MRARPRSARFLRFRCAADSTTVTSSVGRTTASNKWPPRVVPSLKPTTAWTCRLGLPSSPVAMSPNPAKDFTLLVDRDRTVFLLLRVKPAEIGTFESAKRR